MIIVHDPQPAGVRQHVARQGAAPGSGAATSTSPRPTRTTIDAARAARRATTTLRSSTWTATCPRACDGNERVYICPPAIDPLSPKNMALSPEDAAFVCDQFGIDVDRPLICQVSRFDPWKDPRRRDRRLPAVHEEMPEVQLALVGSMATDDPEGWEFFNSTLEYADGDPDIKILNNLNNVGAIEVNAFQSQSDVRDPEVHARGVRPDRLGGALEGAAVHRRRRRRHPAAGAGRRDRLPRVVRRGVRRRARCEILREPELGQAPRRAPARSTCARTSSRRACYATGCGSSRDLR